MDLVVQQDRASKLDQGDVVVKSIRSVVGVNNEILDIYDLRLGIRIGTRDASYPISEKELVSTA